MSVYKVRMTVLAMMAAHDPQTAQDDAMEAVQAAGLTVLQVEEPDKIPDRSRLSAPEEDIYP